MPENEEWGISKADVSHFSGSIFSGFQRFQRSADSAKSRKKILHCPQARTSHLSLIRYQMKADEEAVAKLIHLKPALHGMKGKERMENEVYNKRSFNFKGLSPGGMPARCQDQVSESNGDIEGACQRTRIPSLQMLRESEGYHPGAYHQY